MLDIKFYETYYFCNVVQNVIKSQFNYLLDLEGFCGDLNIYNHSEPFRKYSTLHSFIEYIVDDIYFEAIDDAKNNNLRAQVLKYQKAPIEYALEYHSLCFTSFKGYMKGEQKELCEFNEDDLVNYYLQLKDDVYYELVEQTTKEIFHVLFQNREFLLSFNQMMAEYLESAGGGNCNLFTKKGTFKRRHIPKWVKRAVFYRDKGRCILCDSDLSGTLNANNMENYDHIIPLAKFGFNDVTNIQLLCKACNQKEKKADLLITSSKYYSWYKY